MIFVISQINLKKLFHNGNKKRVILPKILLTVCNRKFARVLKKN